MNTCITNVRVRSETTQTIIRAVRALRRYFAPIAEVHNTCADLDALFDGGEFSGPANARQLDRIEAEAVNFVAGRFGINPLILEAAWQHADDFEHDCFLESISPPKPDHKPEPDDEPAFEERALRRAHREHAEGYYERFEDFGRDDWKLGE